MSRKMVRTLWIDVSEFRYIRDLLYSDHTSEKRKGIDRLTAWKSRSRKLPVAVVCTQDLVEIVLRCGEEESSQSDFKMACAMAITRLVNHHTEEKQTSGRGKPVHELAEKIGLPKWIVDIRHQATHGHMPEEDMLKAALGFCLAWLKKGFWDKQVERMEDGGAGRSPENFNGKDKARIDRTVMAYIAFIAETLENVETNGKQKHTLEEVLHPLKKPMRGVASRHYLAQLLSQDGYLVPTNEQEEALGIRKDGPTNGLLPHALQSFWTPFLDHFQPLGLEPIVVSCIVQHLYKIAGRPDARDNKSVTRYLLGWAKELINRGRVAHASGDLQETSPLASKRAKKLAKWQKTVEICVRKPSKHSLELLPGIMPLVDHPPLTEASQGKILELVQLGVLGPNCQSRPSEIPSNGPSKSSTDAPSQLLTNGLPSLQEMEHLIDAALKGSQRKAGGSQVLSEEGGKQPMETETEGKDRETSGAVEPWSVCKEAVDWKIVPLGMLPGQRPTRTLFQLTEPARNKRKRKYPDSDEK